MNRWEQLVEANKDLAKMDIKGKDYVCVNSRIAGFKRADPYGRIITYLESDDGERCVFRAEVYWGGDDKPSAVGHACERHNEGYINKTSYIENCETSAIGRALGVLGIGSDVSIASAEEVLQAQANQSTDESAKEPWANINLIKGLKEEAIELGVSEQGINDWYSAVYGTKPLTQLTQGQSDNVVAYLRELLETVSDGHLRGSSDD